MGTRGRKSAAALSVVCIDQSRKRLEPPSDLKPQEAALFREIVESCSPGHFVTSDYPLLVSYCTAFHLSRWAADSIDEDGMFATWEKAVKLLATLATRLRLAPQARIDARAAGRSANDGVGPRIWEEGFASEHKP